MAAHGITVWDALGVSRRKAPGFIRPGRSGGGGGVDRVFLSWDRWEANKHLLASVGNTLTDLARERSVRALLSNVRGRLQTAVDVHDQISLAGVDLADNTMRYQAPWDAALSRIVSENGDDLDFVDLNTM